MRALSGKFEKAETYDPLDLRTRIIISLLVSAAAIWVDRAGPLMFLAAATFIYALTSRRTVLIARAYTMVGLMLGLSLVIIFFSFRMLEAVLAWLNSEYVHMAGSFRASLLSNFHIPFLRIIPAFNVLLGLLLNFRTQRFMSAMKSARLPRILFLPLTAFCRYIPEFIFNARTLHDALSVRGRRFSPGSLVVHPVAAVRLFFLPLVVRTLRAADNLAMAAELRRIGYSPRPTNSRPEQMKGLDIAVILLLLAVIAAAAGWQHYLPEAPHTGGMPG